LVWDRIEDSQDPADFETFLEAYPDSPLAPFARNRVKALQARSTADPPPPAPAREPEPSAAATEPSAAATGPAPTADPVPAAAAEPEPTSRPTPATSSVAALPPAATPAAPERDPVPREPEPEAAVPAPDPVSPGAWTETRVALVVGNAAYAHAPALANPRNDAAGMAAALRRLDFEVAEVVDVDRGGMLGALREFSRLLEDAEATTIAARMGPTARMSGLRRAQRPAGRHLRRRHQRIRRRPRPL
jgi:Caspase domain